MKTVKKYLSLALILTLALTFLSANSLIQPVYAAGSTGPNLDTGNDVLYNGRRYSLVADGVIKAVDNADTPTITYNDNVYASLKEFAIAHGLSPNALRQAISRARRQGKTAITYKGVDINLYADGSITVVN